MGVHSTYVCVAGVGRVYNVCGGRGGSRESVQCVHREWGGFKPEVNRQGRVTELCVC